MRILKWITGILAAAGALIDFFLISNDDFYTMELHQAHDLNIKLLIIGTLMMVPFLIVSYIDENYEFRG